MKNLRITKGVSGYVYDKKGNKILDKEGKPLEAGARMATFVEYEGEVLKTQL